MSDYHSIHSQPKSKRLDLISGGARSGKSRFAVELAKKSGKNRLFVATAQAWDEEMRQRIDLHQKERQEHFVTLEAPTQVHQALLKQADFDVVLIDCLTLWISNLLLGDYEDATIREEIHLGLDAALKCSSHVIVVSNEVGLGIVPENALARRFRDLNGRLQQDIAARAHEAYFVSMGYALPVKSLSLAHGANLS